MCFIYLIICIKHVYMYKCIYIYIYTSIHIYVYIYITVYREIKKKCNVHTNKCLYNINLKR